MANNELDNACKELDDELLALTDNCLLEKIDVDSFFVLGNLNRIKKKLLPYHIEQNAHMGLIIELVSSKRLTPKEEQQIKTEFRKIRVIMNDLDSISTDMEKAISDISEKIENTLLGIVTLLSNANGV